MRYTIKAIETYYKGYHFRSRLEARWAVFFDTLNLEYHYEHEGYDLGSGVWYLPDFYLPSLDCWVEIKGRYPTKFEKDKAARLAIGTGKIVFILYGCGPLMVRDGDVRNAGTYFLPDGDSDGCIEFGVCPFCDRAVIGHFGIPFGPEGARSCKCLEASMFKYTRHRLLVRAYAAARAARFER